MRRATGHGLRATACVIALCAIAKADRADYIAEAIAAIRGTEPSELANTRKYLQIVERNKCQAPEMSLRVDCLLEAAKKNCKDEHCRLASDVIATNLLAERVFVPNDVRFAIMSKQKDAKTAIARELHRRYAGLVAEMALSPRFPGAHADGPALAKGIDGFCTDVAGTRDLSWQYCVAAIVWFVATDGDDR